MHMIERDHNLQQEYPKCNMDSWVDSALGRPGVSSSTATAAVWIATLSSASPAPALREFNVFSRKSRSGKTFSAEITHSFVCSLPPPLQLHELKKAYFDLPNQACEGPSDSVMVKCIKKIRKSCLPDLISGRSRLISKIPSDNKYVQPQNMRTQCPQMMTVGTDTCLGTS